MLRPISVVQASTFLDADTGFVRVEVIRVQESHVITGDNRRTGVSGQRHRMLNIHLFVRLAGAHKLYVKSITKNTLPVPQAVHGLVRMIRHDGATDVAVQAP